MTERSSQHREVRSDLPGATQIYEDGLKQGRLLIQRCAACGRHIFTPRMLCPFCGDSALESVEASGGGVVYSTTTVRQNAEEGADYNVCIIELTEGPRMMSSVDGIAPDAVRIGMKVRAAIKQESAGPLVVFVPYADND